ncbi:hypothetical protein BXZ70DRAFT_665394 [Cristinia sonorae]|uniref:Uncharacterized protein n=1 Tax=Cristinia sonorae TaxID=1940300 RepID=A0A8K0UTF1_9AGAR|nr:hypothetical protein BXZ70DRAFT_665394 [Cristinia sonorae]
MSTPAPRTRKRGLTVSAPTPDDLKKAKVDDAPPPLPALPKPQEATTPTPTPKATADAPPATNGATNGSEKTAPIGEEEQGNEAEGASDEDDSEAEDGEGGMKKRPAIHRLPGDGPHVFLAPAQALISIHEEGEAHLDCPFVLKSAVLDLYSKAYGKGDDGEDVDEDVSELLWNSGYWGVVLKSPEAAETKEAEAFFDLWRSLEEPEGGECFYEVMVQREKPQEGMPALEFCWDIWLHKIRKDHRGSWWMTNIAVASEEDSKKAAKLLDENTPNY